MNKMKKLLPILLVLIMLLTVSMPAQAKNEATDAEVKSGSVYAKVNFTVEKVLAFEGTISTDKKTGFKVTQITMSTSKYDGTDPAITEISNEDGKVIFIGANTPTDLKLTVELESTSPMKDGVYNVTLNYGKTSSSGNYSENSKLIARVYVGVAKPSDEDGGSDKDSSSAGGQTTTETVVEQPVEPEAELIITDQPETESNRVGMLGMLDTYKLRSALEEAENLKEAGGLTSTELLLLQDAIDAGEEAMMDDRQSVVDEATANLWSVIEELGGPVNAREEEETPKREGGGVPLAIILAVAAALLAIAAVVTGYLLKKKKKQSYEGAPIVNYQIGDDDEV